MSENKPGNFNLTIWIPLFTSVFYATVALLEIPTATSTNTSNVYLAQTNQEKTVPTISNPNPETSTNKKPVSEQESAPIVDSLEKKIIAELNRVRTNPQAYADWLETQKQYYQGMLLKLPGEQPIRTNRGLRTLEEAIAFLRQQKQLPALSSSQELTSTAKQQIAAISNNQIIKSENNLVYNKVTPEAIVMQLVVDDGFPDRPHRLAIFNQNHQKAGIACSQIPVYDNVCAIAYTPETTDLAQTSPTPSPSNNTTKPETKPDLSTTENSNQLPTPPNVSTSVNPQPEVTASPNTNEEEIIVTTESSASKNEEAPESATNSTTTTTVESNNPETESQTTTTTVESTNPETKTDSEVATNSETDNTLEAVETVEAGILQEGDQTIPNDGSFYDSFPLEGSAGDAFTITLESSEFDTFLAVMDQEGNIIEQNDDINEEDSNSRLEITLPDDGNYSVIVNAYDKGGKGNYVLKISR